MRKFLIGTSLVIGATFLLAGLTMLGAPRSVALIASVLCATIGFCIQLVSAFEMKWKFEGDIRRKQEEHRALMARAATLPPAEAIQLLLRPN